MSRVRTRQSYASFWAAARLRHGWTQREAADFLKVKFQFISAVERGESRLTLTQSRRLIHKYGLRVTDVMNVILADAEVQVRKAFARRRK